MRLRSQSDHFFSGGVAVPRATDIFGEGTGPIVATNFGCNGTEYALMTCLNSSITNVCNHTNDAGVRCQPLSKIWVDS